MPRIYHSDWHPGETLLSEGFDSSHVVVVDSSVPCPTRAALEAFAARYTGGIQQHSQVGLVSRTRHACSTRNHATVIKRRQYIPRP